MNIGTRVICGLASVALVIAASMAVPTSWAEAQVRTVKKTNAALIVAGVVAVVLIGVAVGASGGGSENEPPTSP